MVGALAGAAAIAVAAHGVYAPNSPVFGPAIGRGRNPRAVYLTFDDGPNPVITDRVLDTLAALAVPAAFFMVGSYVTRFPQLARRVLSEGHEVGNHTWSHRKLHRLTPRSVRDEIVRGHAALADALGTAPRAFRAPHGYRTPFVTQETQRLDYRTFGWTYGVWDTERPGADEIRRRMRAKLTGGAILLLHDGDGYALPGDRAQTAEALPGIIADVRRAGFEFRPLTDLLA